MDGSGTGYYNGSVTIGTSGSGTSWSMTDTSRSGQKCGGQNGAAYTGTDNVWGNGVANNLETALRRRDVRDEQGMGHARVLARA